MNILRHGKLPGKRKTLKRAHVKFIYKIIDASGNDLIKFFSFC